MILFNCPSHFDSYFYYLFYYLFFSFRRVILVLNLYLFYNRYFILKYIYKLRKIEFRFKIKHGNISTSILKSRLVQIFPTPKYIIIRIFVYISTISLMYIRRIIKYRRKINDVKKYFNI